MHSKTLKTFIKFEFENLHKLIYCSFTKFKLKNDTHFSLYLKLKY